MTDGRQEASRALKEALSLAPDNVKVNGAFYTIQQHEATQPLLELCTAFSGENDATAGREALWFLSSRNAAYVAADVMIQCFDRVVNAESTDAAVRDDLVASLLHHSVAVRTHLAKRLQASISVVFGQIYHIGDGAANGITVVSLDAAAWSSEADRLSAEQDVFLLFLAKFLEAGHDLDGRALKGISRHLAVDAKRLHVFVDEESFDAILYCLDYRVPQDVRGQATLATAKYLEASERVGEEHLTKFITSRTAKHSSEDLVKAFSVAAAVFPIATPVVSALFLTEGFLASLVPMLDRKSRPIKVEKAALDMLSAACIDKGCREAISKYCLEWMHHVMDDEEDERHGQAAVILAKVQGVTDGATIGTKEKAASSGPDSGPGSDSDSGSSRRSSKSIADVVPTLRNMLIKGGEMDKRTAIEGLAYASMQPSAKDEIIRDTALLQELLQLPGKDSVSPTSAFGYLTLISNLSRFRPNLSEEQKRMSELKAYANASRPAVNQHPLDNDDQVTARCMRLVDSRVVPYLVSLKSSFRTSSLSPASLTLYAQILLSLSRNPSSRGLLAQQGAVQLLLQLLGSTALEAGAKPIVSHAIARILISVDPALLPSYTASSITPLVSLLTPAESIDNSPRDFLPIFEALLALTNLASDPNLDAATVIVRDALGTIEDLMLSSNHALQRAATELVCNIVASPAGMEKFADGSPAAGRRLHVLLALTDSEDVATRRAAGGALAGITEFDGAAQQILNRERGLELLVRMCKDEDKGVVHRGAVCLRNVICLDGEIGRLARMRLRESGGADVLKGLISESSEEGVLETVLDALKSLGK